MSVDALGQLGKTDFLNLLATQLRYQNPMEPTNNTEFISQLAQFSALENSENLREQIQTLSLQEQQSQAAAMLGKTAAGISSEDLTAFSGVVTKVDFNGLVPLLTIEGRQIRFTDVTSIA